MRCLAQGWIQTPEPTGEKKKKRFIPTILYIYHKKMSRTAQTIATITLSWAFFIQVMYLRGSDNSKEPRQSGLMLSATILNKIFMCIISNESAAVENQVDFSRNVNHQS